MSFELKGATITDILDVNEGTSKAGKPWKSLEFVAETDEQYNNLYCFKLFQGEKNSKVDDFINEFGTGDVVDVLFNVNTNKWQKDASSPVKYFVGLDVYKVEKVGGSSASADSSDPGPSMDDFPPMDETDDLPF